MTDVYKAVYDYLVNNPYSFDDGDEWYSEYWEQVSIEEDYNGKDTIINYESESSDRDWQGDDMWHSHSEKGSTTLEEFINFLTNRKFGNETVEENWWKDKEDLEKLIKDNMLEVDYHVFTEYDDDDYDYDDCYYDE